MADCRQSDCSKKSERFKIEIMMPFDSDEETDTQQPSKTGRLRCRDIMTSNVTAANPAQSLRAIAGLMRDGDLGVLPIVDDRNKLVGIVTDRDLVVRAAANGLDLNRTAVGEIMTDVLHTARADDFVFQAIRLMGDKQIRRVPVVSETGELQGILSLADIALEMEDEREIAEALEDISSGTAFWRKK